MSYTRYRHVAIEGAKSPPTEAQLHAIEDELGAKLPLSFREYLAVANGARTPDRRNDNMRVIQVIAISVLLATTALAQKFPWEIFKPRTLKEVIAITNKAVKPDDDMFLAHDQLESRVEVVFTGKSRPIGKLRKNFIEWWFGMLRSEQKHLAELYDSEYLYKEGEAEYWLPTSKPITKYFDKELKPGDKMDLYLISTGAYRNGADIDCVLLVEEFQKKAP